MDRTASRLVHHLEGHVSCLLGVIFYCFPGILLSRKPAKALGKWLVFEKDDC